VAQSIIELLMSFPHPEVQMVAYIDNVFFAADSEDAMIAAVTTFVKRCADVGLALNVPAVLMTDHIAELTSQTKAMRGTPAYRRAVDDLRNAEWAAISNGTKILMAIDEVDVLGEHYHRRHATRNCTTSSLQKLTSARRVVEEQATGLVSRRQLAAVYGIVLYTTRVLAVSPAPYYNAMAALRKLAATGEHGWDDVAERLTPVQHAELAAWIDRLSINQPVPLVTPSAERHCTVFTDASSMGWGAVAIFESGETRTLSRRWTAQELGTFNLMSSVTAEPRAVELTLMELFAAVPGSRPLGVEVVSDHAGLVFAGNAGYGTALTYNTICRRLQSPELSHLRVSFSFVPGSRNPADVYSRFFARADPGPPTVRFGLPTVCVGFPSVRVG
jgi:hypothetical protein